MSRWWTAECAYRGCESFLFGSVHIVADGVLDAEAKAREALAERWRRVSPFPPPDIVNLIPGRLSVAEDLQP